MKCLVSLVLIVFTHFASTEDSKGKTALDLFEQVSDNRFFQREYPWHAHRGDFRKEFWEAVKKNPEEFKKAKFKELHRKVDQMAFLYLLNNNKTVKDFENTSANDLPLPILIQKVFYYQYRSSINAERCTDVLVRHLDNKLVAEVCLDMSTYRHIYLNGMQLPEKIGRVKHKLSPQILEKLSRSITKEKDYFYHRLEVLISIISGSMNLEKKDALKNFAILFDSLKEELIEAQSLKVEVQSALSLVEACITSKEEGNDKPVIELMKKGDDLAYHIALSGASKEAIPVFLGKYPNTKWKEVEDALRLGEELKRQVSEAIALNDWRKPYYKFLQFALEKPKDFEVLRSKSGQSDLDVMKVTKKWAEKN